MRLVEFKRMSYGGERDPWAPISEQNPGVLLEMKPIIINPEHVVAIEMSDYSQLAGFGTSNTPEHECVLITLRSGQSFGVVGDLDTVCISLTGQYADKACERSKDF